MKNEVIYEELIDEELGLEIARAREAGYPVEIINRAYEVTAQRMRSEKSLRSPRHFFRAVLRRLLFKTRRKGGRSKARAKIKRSYFLEALVADLEKAGLSKEEIEKKLSEEWPGVSPLN